MDYNRALRLFNLDNSFTLEELKRKYKELLKKYHPDNNLFNKEEASQKTNEVINAYNLLRKYASNKKKSSEKRYDNSRNDFNNNTYKDIEIEILKQKIRDKYLNEKIKYTNSIYLYYMNKQRTVVYDTLYNISKIKSQDEILWEFSKLTENVKIIIRNMINTLIQRDTIENENVKKRIIKLQYTCDNVFDAYSEYNKIIKDFNKVCTKLESVIEKFKNYIFFDKLESQIKKAKENVLKDECLLDNIELSAYEFEIQVNDIFKKYEKKLKDDRIKVNELIKKITKYKDSIDNFKNKYNMETLCDELLGLIGEDNFDIKYKELNDKLNELIRESEKNKINQSNIFNKLVTAYYTKVANLNLPSDLLEVKKETDKLNKIIKILENIDTFSLDALYFLKKLETIEDNKIDKTLNMILYGETIKYEEIFLDKYSPKNEMVIVENIDENYVYYRLVDDLDIIKSTTLYFMADYISLKELINTSDFVGKNIFLESEKFRYINNPILLCSNPMMGVVVDCDYSEFVIIDPILDNYNLESEVILKEMSKNDIYNMISNIAKNKASKQYSYSKNEDKPKIYK